jgi:cytochrome c oxidase subunit 1
MGDHHHGPAKGISRWLFTTNHKDIGTMYLWFSFAMFILGGAFAMIIRAELFQPGMQLVEPGFFNQMTTLHGLVMVFGAIMPSFVGLANWMIPMMIGAPDMALPRMNNWSFWILPPGFLMLASTLFMEGGAPAFGWTFYAPLSTTYAAPSVTFFIFAIHILGVSSIMGSINIIATVMNMRAPGHDLHEDAAVCMDLADHRVPAGCSNARIGRCGDHDADGYSLRHQLLLCRRWW